MIRPLLATSLLALGMLFAANNPAHAQQQPFFQGTGYGNPNNNFSPYNNPFNPLSTPPLSPWLNLGARAITGAPFTNPVGGYFLGVIPEQQRRAEQATYGAAIQNLYQREQTPAVDNSGIMGIQKLPPTGHATGYQYYGSYYTFPVRQPTYMPFPAGGGR